MVKVPYASSDDAARTLAFFHDRPAGLALWQELAAAATRWGPVTAVATQSRAALLGRTRFLWCPHAHLDGHVFIRFLLPRRVDHPRLHPVGMTGGRWSHRVKIDALDDEVMAWFCEAAAWDLADRV